MINLAVIELKDIIKYLIKITIIILLAVGLTKFFSSFKTKLNIEKNSFLSCLDVVIPSMGDINKTEQSTKKVDKAEIKPLKMVLETELGLIDTLEKNGETEADETSSGNK